MSEDQKCDLLQFVTSCPRPPLLGFKTLNPKVLYYNYSLQFKE